MKRFILMSIVLLGMGSLVSCLAGNRVTEERRVEGFRSIDINGVASVCFTQADAYAFRMEGDENLVKATSAEVEDGTLVVSQRKVRKSNKGLTIYISAPELEAVSFSGVGSFRCKDRLDADDIRFDVDAVGTLSVDDLHCRNLTLDFDGVGDASLHVDCDMLEAEVDGVGSVTLSGRAGNSKISRSGVGSCNVRNLKVGE